MAQNTSAQEIGSYFHDLRASLGLSLRETASDTISAARLSRFERGTSDISTSAAMTLMNILGMNRTEIRTMQHRNAYVFPTNLVSLILINDVAAINAASARFFAAHGQDPQTYLVQVEQLIFQCAATDITSDFKLSVLDEHVLSKFLAYPESWHNVEITAAFCVAPFASTEFRAFLDECWLKYVQASKDFASICTLTCGLAIAAGKFTAEDKLQHYAKRLTAQAQTQSNMIYIRQMRPLITLINWRANNTAADFAQLCTNLTIVGAGAMVPFMTQCWRVLQQPRTPWSRAHAYQVHDALPYDAQSIGSQLGAIRRQRDLPMATVCQGWSLSAQSRFESNDSQLSFIRTNVLCAFLLTEWTDLRSSTFALVGQAFNAITALKVEKHNLNPVTAAPVIEALITNLGTVPPTLRATLILPVRMYSYAFNYDPIPDVLMAQAVKTLTNIHSCNQAYWILFNCSCGNMDGHTSVQIWHNLIGADNNYQSPIGYRDLMDFYIAQQVNETKDVQLAKSMLEDLVHAPVEPWISVETMFNHLARMLCQAVITPEKHLENDVAAFAHTMVALGYTREIQEQVANLADTLRDPDFLADIAELN